MAPPDQEISGTGFTTKVAAEFLGNFVFVLVGAGSPVATSALGITDAAASLFIAALANGLGLAMVVSATLAVSGDSLNPAVTICLFVTGKLRARKVIPYIVAELAGATLAGLALVASSHWLMGTQHTGAHLPSRVRSRLHRES